MKITADDVTPELRRSAAKWINRYEGSFEFAVAMRDAFRQRGTLSDKMWAGVINCQRAEERRKSSVAEKPPQKPRDETVSVEVVPVAQVPDGTFTVVFDREADDYVTISIRTQAPTARFAPGERVLSFLSAPERFTGFGFLKSGRVVLWKRFQAQQDGGRLVEAVRVLLQDPKAAASAYGLREGRCGLCGRPLTTPDSIERGIGPICAGKAGW